MLVSQLPQRLHVKQFIFLLQIKNDEVHQMPMMTKPINNTHLLDNPFQSCTCLAKAFQIGFLFFCYSTTKITAEKRHTVRNETTLLCLRACRQSKLLMWHFNCKYRKKGSGQQVMSHTQQVSFLCCDQAALKLKRVQKFEDCKCGN